jgi:hypothetical protein
VKVSKIRRYRGAETQESTAECRQAHVMHPIHRPGRLRVHGHHLRCLRPHLIRKFPLTPFSLGTRTEFYWYFVQPQTHDFRHLYHVFFHSVLSACMLYGCCFDTLFPFVRLLYTFTCCVCLLSWCIIRMRCNLEFIIYSRGAFAAIASSTPLLLCRRYVHWIL